MSTEQIARRIHRRVLGQRWEDEDPAMRAVFLDYAKAAQGAVVDCEDLADVLAPVFGGFHPDVLRNAAERATEV